MNSTCERICLSPGQIAARFDITRQTVGGWMEHGVPVNGMRVKLQFRRIGCMRKTSEVWLEEFLRQCNADLPPTVQTPAQAEAQADREVARCLHEMAT